MGAGDLPDAEEHDDRQHLERRLVEDLPGWPRRLAAAGPITAANSSLLASQRVYSSRDTGDRQLHLGHS